MKAEGKAALLKDPQNFFSTETKPPIQLKLTKFDSKRFEQEAERIRSNRSPAIYFSQILSST